MKTVIIPLSEQSQQLPQRIIEKRTMSNTDFIKNHGSGTLKDNKDYGFIWSIQCLSERLAYTFGYGFTAQKSHLVVFNDSISECDETAYTMSGRWFKAYQSKKLFNEDYFEIKYVSIKNEDGSKNWEGIGVIVRETSATFIPDNIIVVAKVCQFNHHTQQWEKPVNFA
jgi:hypothetical protein